MMTTRLSVLDEALNFQQRWLLQTTVMVVVTDVERFELWVYSLQQDTKAITKIENRLDSNGLAWMGVLLELQETVERIGCLRDGSGQFSAVGFECDADDGVARPSVAVEAGWIFRLAKEVAVGISLHVGDSLVAYILRDESPVGVRGEEDELVAISSRWGAFKTFEMRVWDVVVTKSAMFAPTLRLSLKAGTTVEAHEIATNEKIDALDALFVHPTLRAHVIINLLMGIIRLALLRT